MKVTVRRIIGLVLMGFGFASGASLFLSYMLVLLKADELLPVPAYLLMREFVFNAEGAIAMIATFVFLFIPFLICFLIGQSVWSGKNALRFSLILFLGITWVIAVFLAGLGTVLQIDKIVARIDPFSAAPEAPLIEKEIPQSVRIAFRTALQNEVNRTMGMPIEGYEPFMFLDAFRGLTETDFEGVEASIGHYTVAQGRLVHQMDNTKLVHSAARSITDRGMDTLLANVSLRLHIDLSQSGTLTMIMEALSPESDNEGVPQGAACTQEAKLCPDGSAVGRQGPSCEFAPCP